MQGGQLKIMISKNILFPLLNIRNWAYTTSNFIIVDDKAVIHLSFPLNSEQNLSM